MSELDSPSRTTSTQAADPARPSDGLSPDRSVRHRHHEQLRRENQLYRAWVNLRANSEKHGAQADRRRMMQRHCRTLATETPFVAAWMVLFDDFAQPTAHAEFGVGIDFDLLADCFQSGALPHCAQRALTCRGPVRITRPELECGACPLVASRSSCQALCLLLRDGNQVHGVLTVSAPRSLQLEPEEIVILQVMAADVAHELSRVAAVEHGRETRAALRDSEDRYRLLFESTADPIFVLDADGRFVDSNPAARRFLCCSATELYARNVADFVQPVDHRSSGLRRLRRREGEAETRYVIRGANRVLEVTVTPTSWRGKHARLCIGKDVTESQHAAEALRRSAQAVDDARGELEATNALLRSILEGPRDIAIFALDRRYRCTACNHSCRRAIKRLWGVDFGVGDDMLEALGCERNRGQARRIFDRALRGHPTTVTEHYADHTATDRLFEIHCSPIRDASGQVTGLTAYLTETGR